MSDTLRTYGGWRERRGFGIGNLSGRQTAAGLGVVVIALALVLVMPTALPLLAVPAALVVALMMIRVRGESIAGVTSRHLGFRARERKGETSFRAVTRASLPSDLAPLSLHVARDGSALIVDPQCRTLTAMVPVEPQGLEFADAPMVQDWVTGWGRWLAHLGYVPGMAHVTVTVATRPLSDPRPARGTPADLLAEIRSLQEVRHESRTVLSLTVSGTADERTEGLLRDAVGSLQALNRCGMTVLPVLGSDEVVGWLRSCYDPGSDLRPPVEVVWEDGRPTAVEEGWDRYQHDGSWSTAFAWDECPGEAMAPQALTALLGPAGYAKRVALVFAPAPAQAAAREVDRQAEAAAFRSAYRRRLGRDETARDRLDVERARQTATEQAHGAGLVDVSVFAVASVARAEELDQAAADLHNRAGQARIRLRRAYGEQAAAFAATLGLGRIPRRRW